MLYGFEGKNQKCFHKSLSSFLKVYFFTVLYHNLINKNTLLCLNIKSKGLNPH